MSQNVQRICDDVSGLTPAERIEFLNELMSLQVLNYCELRYAGTCIEQWVKLRYAKQRDLEARIVAKGLVDPPNLFDLKTLQHLLVVAALMGGSDYKAANTIFGYLKIIDDAALKAFATDQKWRTALLLLCNLVCHHCAFGIAEKSHIVALKRKLDAVHLLQQAEPCDDRLEPISEDPWPNLQSLLGDAEDSSHENSSASSPRGTLSGFAEFNQNVESIAASGIGGWPVDAKVAAATADATEFSIREVVFDEISGMLKTNDSSMSVRFVAGADAKETLPTFTADYLVGNNAVEVDGQLLHSLMRPLPGLHGQQEQLLEYDSTAVVFQSDAVDGVGTVQSSLLAASQPSPLESNQQNNAIASSLPKPPVFHFSDVDLVVKSTSDVASHQTETKPIVSNNPSESKNSVEAFLAQLKLKPLAEKPEYGSSQVVSEEIDVNNSGQANSVDLLLAKVNKKAVSSLAECGTIEAASEDDANSVFGNEASGPSKVLPRADRKRRACRFSAVSETSDSSAVEVSTLSSSRSPSIASEAAVKSVESPVKESSVTVESTMVVSNSSKQASASSSKHSSRIPTPIVPDAATSFRALKSPSAASILEDRAKTPIIASAYVDDTPHSALVSGSPLPQNAVLNKPIAMILPNAASSESNLTGSADSELAVPLAQHSDRNPRSFTQSQPSGQAAGRNVAGARRFASDFVSGNNRLSSATASHVETDTTRHTGSPAAHRRNVTASHRSSEIPNANNNNGYGRHVNSVNHNLSQPPFQQRVLMRSSSFAAHPPVAASAAQPQQYVTRVLGLSHRPGPGGPQAVLACSPPQPASSMMASGFMAAPISYASAQVGPTRGSLPQFLLLPRSFSIPPPPINAQRPVVGVSNATFVQGAQYACCNCGLPGHSIYRCPRPTMADRERQGQFRLNYD